MICVHCSAPVSSLYERYKGNHIRLAVCNNCHQVADKYIEYDKVLLFIDLMLLKPQPYKHTIYNLLIINKKYEHPCNDFRFKDLDTTRTKQKSIKNASNNDNQTSGNNFWNTYGYVIRLTILLFLFEVYIKWAYEEKNFAENPATASFVIQKVLNGPLQYVFFLTITAIESMCFNISLCYLSREFLSFGKGADDHEKYDSNLQIVVTDPKKNDLSVSDLKEQSAAKFLDNKLSLERSVAVITTTILVTNMIKLFPIVMLIWPYDNLILNMTRILIQFVHIAMLVEGLHIVLLDNKNNHYWKITLVVLLSELIKFVVSNIIIDLGFKYWYGISWIDLFTDQYTQIKMKVQLGEKLFDKALIYLGL